MSNGWKNHLWGSIVTESARSMPGTLDRSRGERSAAAAVRGVHVEPEVLRSPRGPRARRRRRPTRCSWSRRPPRWRTGGARRRGPRRWRRRPARPAGGTGRRTARSAGRPARIRAGPARGRSRSGPGRSRRRGRRRARRHAGQRWRADRAARDQPGEVDVARDGHRHRVRHDPARREHAERVGAEARERAQPAHGLLLDERRARPRVPDVHALVDDLREELAHDGHEERGRSEVAERPAMDGAELAVDEAVAELGEHGLGGRRGLGRRAGPPAGPKNATRASAWSVSPVGRRSPSP